MRHWVWMLSGLVLWAAHFLGVYFIASMADVVSRADDPTWRAAGLGFSVLCALGAVTLVFAAARRLRSRRSTTPDRRFRDQLALLGSGVALIAIVWQALPTVIGH